MHKKWSFRFRISSVNVTKPHFLVDLVTFTEQIPHGKLRFFCNVYTFIKYWRKALNL